MKQKTYQKALASINSLDDLTAQEIAKLQKRIIALSRTIDSVPKSEKKWDYHIVAGNKLFWLYLGCPWFDQSGGCTVCDGYNSNLNLNSSNPNREENIRKTIDEVLEFIEKDDQEILNIGSAATLNNKSMPVSARKQLFEGVNRILKKYQNPVYLFETRLTDIDEETLSEIRQYIDPKIRVEIGVGIEASNRFIREVLVKKGYPKDAIEDLRKKVELAKKYNIGIEAHVLLGIPGLTEIESIASAVETIKYVLDTGVSRAILMTGNIKASEKYLGLWLHKQGEYDLPSLHATTEVLLRSNSQGYYNVLPYGFSASDPVKEYAKGCEECTDRLIKIFDTYATTCINESPEKAADYLKTAPLDCLCKTEWLEQIEKQEKPLVQRYESWIERIESKRGIENV